MTNIELWCSQITQYVLNVFWKLKTFLYSLKVYFTTGIQSLNFKHYDITTGENTYSKLPVQPNLNFRPIYTKLGALPRTLLC